MKTALLSPTFGAILTGFLLAALGTVEALPATADKRDVDTRFPYTGPEVPVGDWIDQSINGHVRKGFPRLVEAPAVKAPMNATNNVNVISLSYIPNGINVHFQTPFGLGEVPSVHFGTSPTELCEKASGYSNTYDRTPPCSLAVVSQCSQFFHNVQISNLIADTTYYYQIPAANGTIQSPIFSFKTAPTVGNKKPFKVAVLNDMGYTNAQGTFAQLSKAVDKGVSFAWHGGDLSYADDWYSGILPCASDWPVCYNGTSSQLPNSPPLPIPEEYRVPLPKGEVANQGGALGGDMSVLYESNWDLWQQWMNNITLRIPYMTNPGNHEATCAEFDGPSNILTAYLNDNKLNKTATKTDLNYYSCPPSQRNFTAYTHRFRNPGNESGGVGNFWYSFDFGMAHFVSIDGETDFPSSPEAPFLRDNGQTLPTKAQTFITDSGPFGTIKDKKINEKEAYEQYNWLAKDLASVDRTKTPWVIAMSHRPMYSTQTAAYQSDLRSAFEDLLISNGVDAYLSGHIHWYERLYPLTRDGTIDETAIINNHTYRANEGTSLTHIINGMAGNIESHSTLGADQRLRDITAVLDDLHYGFATMTFFNESVMKWDFVRGDGLGLGDSVTLIREAGTRAHAPGPHV